MDNVIGRKVRVKPLNEIPTYLHSYCKNFAGEIGVITGVSISPNEIEYRIDLGWATISAVIKYFDFIDEEENKNMAALKGYKSVAVIEFGSGCCKSTYHYAIYDDGTNYKPNDIVYVSGNATCPIASIKEIITPEEADLRFKKSITAEVICKIDKSAYENRVNNRKRAEDIKKKMDKMIKVMDENKKYEMYANENPELLKLLNEFKEVSEM